MSEEEQRFWIDIKPVKNPFTWGCAVVDEEAGGVIAYFATEDDAQLFVDSLKCEEKKP